MFGLEVPINRIDDKNPSFFKTRNERLPQKEGSKKEEIGKDKTRQDKTR
jgi:hypothetical protein